MQRTDVLRKSYKENLAFKPESVEVPKTSIIIPAYNEELGLKKVVKAISALDGNYEAIVIDDGSTDKTFEVAREFFNLNFINMEFQIISHKRNMGKGAAMMSGIRHAKGEYLIFIDSDNTYPIKAIPKIVETFKSGYDMVVGSRSEGNGRSIPKFNQLGNHIFKFLFKSMYGSKNSDPLSGLYGIKAQHLKNMELVSTGFQIETEITIKAAAMGLKVCNIPIDYNDRMGETKLDPIKDGYRIFKALLEFAPLNSPHKIFTIPGMLFIGGGLLTFGLVTMKPAFFKYFSLGIHTFLLSNLLFIIGIQLIIFGISTDLYAVLHKFRRPKNLEISLNNKLLRGMKYTGMLCLFVGLYLGSGIFKEWIDTGFSSISYLENAIGTFTFVILGLQLVFSSIYLGIFSSEFARREEVLKVDGESLVRRLLKIMPSDTEAEKFVISRGYVPKKDH